MCWQQVAATIQQHVRLPQQLLSALSPKVVQGCGIRREPVLQPSEVGRIGHGNAEYAFQGPGWMRERRLDSRVVPKAFDAE